MELATNSGSRMPSLPALDLHPRGREEKGTVICKYSARWILRLQPLVARSSRIPTRDACSHYHVHHAAVFSIAVTTDATLRPLAKPC